MQSPAYRDDKIGTSLALLPDLLAGHQGPQLTAHAEDITLSAPHAELVSNNPDGTNSPLRFGRRDGWTPACSASEWTA